MMSAKPLSYPYHPQGKTENKTPKKENTKKPSYNKTKQNNKNPTVVSALLSHVFILPAVHRQLRL